MRREPAGDPRADPAEADDPGALAAQRGARIGHLAPAALADLAIRLGDAVPHRQQQRDGVIGHVVRVDARGSRQADAAPLQVAEIDMAEPG